AGLLPDRVLAAGEGGNTLVILGGRRPDSLSYVYYELLCGTWGGRPDRDGNDGLCNPANVASNIPVEDAECEYPIRIERYGLVRDSGGAGRFRGGLAVEREWRLLHGEAHPAVLPHRRPPPPSARRGAPPGTPPTRAPHRVGGGEEVCPTIPPPKRRAGERLSPRRAGGGAHGPPRGRSRAAVTRDVKNDKVSLEA